MEIKKYNLVKACNKPNFKIQASKIKKTPKILNAHKIKRINAIELRFIGFTFDMHTNKWKNLKKNLRWLLFGMKLKGRTCKLLPLMSRPEFVVQRDNEYICCICRQNSQCLHESSNCHWLDKKQVVGWTNKRNEMWQWSYVNWIPFIATPKERKKQEMMSKMAYLKFRNESKSDLHVEYQKYRKKMGAWASLEVRFLGHMSRLWWDGVCNICEFRPARTGIKEVISALLCSICCFTVGLCKPVYWCSK